MDGRVVERFWRSVRIADGPGCWCWTGKTSGSTARYGDFRIGTKSSDPRVKAHRFSYELLVGPIPDGLELDHLCRNKLCVNPDHLEPVTHAENRRRARLAVCRSGRHDLTDPVNMRWDGDGNRRGCRLCHMEATQRRKT